MVQPGVTRRDLLKLGGGLVVLAACGDTDGLTTTTAATTTTTAPTTTAPTAVAPTTKFVEPATALSGDLKILQWNHFINQPPDPHDKWYDAFAKEWGDNVGVNVTVDHINIGDVGPAIAGEIASGVPEHDLLQHITVLGQFEPSAVDMVDVVTEAENRYGPMLDLTRRSSLNPNTGKFYAYAPAWVPDPGDYRKSLWEPVGFPNGPSTWDELLEGGSAIFANEGIQMGIGMSQELDSDMAARALLWSYGAFVQDANENVIINSDETVAAVEYMKNLFENAMTDEVFAWVPASNNQGLAAGELSYILNSISAWRTAQVTAPEVAADIFFTPALRGPADALVASHVMYNWIIPDFDRVNVEAAQQFLLHYTENLDSVTWNSKLYDFPAFPERVPELNNWLANDPFGAQPPDKLKVLETALDWATNVGHPGPASPAIGQVFGERILPVMFAEAAMGTKTPAEAVADAEAQINAIFDDWRAQGLVGGG